MGMNLVYCCLEWEPIAGGGIRTYVESLATYLVELGHRVHIVTFAHCGTEPGRSERNGVVVHRVAFSHWQRRIYRLSLATPLHAVVFRLFYGVQVQRQVQALITAGEADLVESPDYAAEGFWLTYKQRRCSALRRVPHLVHLHTPSYLLNRINLVRGRLRTWPFEALENWNLRHAQHLCAPSRALIERVRHDLGLNGRDIRLEPYPSDVVGGIGQHAEVPAQAPAGPVRILYVGRLEFRKGVTLLVEALNRLGLEDPTLGAELIGGDTDSAPGGGSMRGYLLAQLRPEVAGRVRFIDP
jgi:glycosyltransferase involved in cell wall biosynthesis